MELDDGMIRGAVSRVVERDSARHVDRTLAVLLAVLDVCLVRHRDVAVVSRSYLAQATGAGEQPVWQALRRLIEYGVIRDVTGTVEGNEARAAVDGSMSGTLYRTTGAYRVCRIETQGSRQPDGAGLSAIQTQGQHHPRDGGIETQGSPLPGGSVINIGSEQGSVGIQTQGCSSSYSLGEGNNSLRAYTREGGPSVATDGFSAPETLTGWVRMIGPRTDTWSATGHRTTRQGRGSSLGPRAQRAYGVLVAAPGPVAKRAIRDQLSIGRHKTDEVLADLSAHGLAVQNEDHHWLPGPVTPADHATDCPLCAQPAEAEPTPKADPPADRQEARSFPATPELVPCGSCGEYGYQGHPCPCCGRLGKRVVTTAEGPAWLPAVFLADGEPAFGPVSPELDVYSWPLTADGAVVSVEPATGQPHRPASLIRRVDTGRYPLPVLHAAYGYADLVNDWRRTNDLPELDTSGWDPRADPPVPSTRVRSPFA